MGKFIVSRGKWWKCFASFICVCLDVQLHLKIQESLWLRVYWTFLCLEAVTRGYRIGLAPETHAWGHGRSFQLPFGSFRALRSITLDDHYAEHFIMPIEDTTVCQVECIASLWALFHEQGCTPSTTWVSDFRYLRFLRSPESTIQ